ncbi:MAG: YciI family protein [Gemmatimonadaceae bacterium]
MRFMMIVKANKDSEAGVMPSTDALIEMNKYNEELIKAGVMLAGEGLHASSKGARVEFSGDKRTVVDGPFSETKELIAGFWIIQVRSKAEAIEWARRIPHPAGSEDSAIELRQVFDTADFAPQLEGSEEGRKVLKDEQEFRQRTEAAARRG